MIKPNRIDQILNDLGLPPEKVDYEKAVRLTKQRIRPKGRKGPCGKTCYSSEQNANNATHSMLKSKRANTSFLRAYFCKRCRAWHMSSTHHV